MIGDSIHPNLRNPSLQHTLASEFARHRSPEPPKLVSGVVHRVNRGEHACIAHSGLTIGIQLAHSRLRSGSNAKARARRTLPAR